MIHVQRLVVAPPAHSVEMNFRRPIEEIPEGFVDDLILAEDGRLDQRAELSRALGPIRVVHDFNLGNRANPKSCPREASRRRADFVIRLPSDSRYAPKPLVTLASLLAIFQGHLVLGARIPLEGALRGCIRFYKYLAKRVLTPFGNVLLAKKSPEYYTGYRAFSYQVPESLPPEESSDDLVFESQMLAQAAYFEFSVGDVPCLASCFPEATPIDFGRIVAYGSGVVSISILCRLNTWRIFDSPLFSRLGRCLVSSDLGREGPRA